jgi:MoCo/4Fe-4S cofactor protein with predicted Tat translocation signal
MPSLGPEQNGADLAASSSGDAYWRSMEELADAPEFRRFLEAEFPQAMPQWMSRSSRRQFLRLMGASMALAGLTSCRWPVEKIAPYNARPENRLPGVPVQYSTAIERGGVATGLLVTSYDGRPIKVEGNPSHPFSNGATDAFAQASVLELYDPDRSTKIREAVDRESYIRSWDEFVTFAKAHFGSLRSVRGAGLAILSEQTSSPSLRRLREDFAKQYPEARWYEYEPVSRDAELEGSRLAFGRPVRPQYELAEADVIVCFDDDLLWSHPAGLKHARDFTKGRSVDASGRRLDRRAGMNRLYAFEPGYSLTGGMADHRYAVSAGAVPAVLCRLAAKIMDEGLLPASGEEAVREAAAAVGADSAGGSSVVSDEVLAVVARDLARHTQRAVLTVGPRQPAAVHALVFALNEALGGVGQVVRYTEASGADRADHASAIRELSEQMSAGAVQTLVILGGNPAYNAPADLGFGEALSEVPTTVHLGLYRDETGKLCRWHVPHAHYLETWGDVEAYDGTVTIQQPLIEALYGGKSPMELLAVLLGEETSSGYDLVRGTWRGSRDEVAFERYWQEQLHRGTVEGTTAKLTTPSATRSDWAEPLRNCIASWAAAKSAAGEGVPAELVFLPDASAYDGRHANNGWLQEMPDPMTKLTWDNAAIIGPVLASQLRVQRGDMVQIEHAGRTLDVPVFVLPGVAPMTVLLPLGYGRAEAGRVGTGVGFNTYTLRTSDAMEVAAGAKVRRIRGKHTLAVTQDHHAMDSEVTRKERARRAPTIIREATVEEYKEHPDFAKHVVHHPPLVSLWDEYSFDGPRWGMAIDLNKCIGCSGCVVACQAENNVPVVGKDEVEAGREMHWLRIDRYFRGEPADAQVAHQPVACQHCENAPCEQVCPVAATVHSEEGLNDMVYNRCIGTRYCSNNCPYKVRRFNWFNNQEKQEDVALMVLNPDVTVRSRGVMEKCTFCVQRISAAKIAAKNDRRPIEDGEIVPACAQSCPTEAIVFGDLSDPESRVSKLHGEKADRAYALLAELNVKPRTNYLARLRNPAPELAPPSHGHDAHGNGHEHGGDEGGHGAHNEGGHGMEH